MNRHLILAAVLVLLALPTLAADGPNPWRISVLATDIADGNQPWENDAHAGAGLAMAYTFRPQWDLELAAAMTSYREPYTIFFHQTMPSGVVLFVPATEFRQFTVHPIDLVATRRFTTSSRFTPYVRAGVRYVNGPGNPTESFVAPGAPSSPTFVLVRSGYGFGDESRVSAQAGAGVLLQLTPRTALRAEVNRLLRTDATPFDPLTRGAVGLSWKF